MTISHRNTHTSAEELVEIAQTRERHSEVPYALATVLKISGSSYRRVGARMLVNIHGWVAGCISGGCLERNILSEGRSVLLTGKAKLLEFDATESSDTDLGASMGCGGKLLVGIELLLPGQPWVLGDAIQRIRKSRETGAVITRAVQESSSVRLESTALFADTFADSLGALPSVWHDKIKETWEAQESCSLGGKSDFAIMERLEPPRSLLIFGGGPNSLPLVRLSREMGYEVTVIDWRPNSIIKDSFVGAHQVLNLKPHQVLSSIRPDKRTLAVLMNHHFDTDCDLLKVLLPQNLPYIALVGSRKRAEQILLELSQSGFEISEQMRDRINAPAGLDIGAETPLEIALAILAEMQASIANRQGGKLKLRSTPIHSA